MIYKIFSVFDEKAKAFLPPFFLPEKAMAVRVFSDCANDVNHQFGKHPEDYTLFELGNFDGSSGQLTPSSHGLELVVSGVQVVKPALQRELALVSKEDFV